MVNKISLYLEAIKLRKIGKSYSEIHNLLGIPKSTLSSWFSKKDWSKKIKISIIKNKRKSWIRSLKLAGKALVKLKKERDKNFANEARVKFVNLKLNPLFLVGITAYWGEGNKASGSRVSLANSDPKLIGLIVKFYRECLKIPEESLRVELFIYKDIDKTKTKKFWSKKLKIPDSQFIKIQVLKSKTKLTKRRLTYGICSVYFSSTKHIIMIREWIKLLGLEMRV